MAKLYKVKEFADLAGVTVRALHHYDRLKLLQPRRAESKYRLYSDSDLERLEQIVALKFLGLPLKQIKTVLDRETRPLLEILHAQRLSLEHKRRQLDGAIAAIQDAERVVRPGRQAGVDLLKKIIEVIEMQSNADFMAKYYNEAAQTKMANLRENWDPELQAKATQQWTELFRDVEAALDQDPSRPTAQALLDRWTALVESFTGGDPDVSSGLRQAWSDQQNWPADMRQQTVAFGNPAVWDFIRRASEARAR